MFIRTVDEGLERMLRAELPFPPDIGDVSFAVPNDEWTQARTRPTINLFLYEVLPSSRPGQAIMRRVDADGRAQRRRPLPVVDLNYLVSAWAEDPLDEHELLGALVSHFAAQGTLSAEYLPGDATSGVHIIFGGDDKNRLRELWRAAGGDLRASFTISVAVAAESFEWVDEAPLVTRVLGTIGRRT